jgi:hypothetical protein
MVSGGFLCKWKSDYICGSWKPLNATSNKTAAFKKRMNDLTYAISETDKNRGGGNRDI